MGGTSQSHGGVQVTLSKLDDVLIVVAQLGAEACQQMANKVVTRVQVGHLVLSIFDFIMLALLLSRLSDHLSSLVGADEDFVGEVSFLAPGLLGVGSRCHEPWLFGCSEG